VAGKSVIVADSRISSSAYIGEGVQLGVDVAVGPGAVLLGPASIGDRVWIGAGAAIGGPPEISSLEQNTAWTGQLAHSGVEIGDDVVIREHVVIHQGSQRPTRVGRGSWLLNTCYLAHDVLIGEGVTVSAGVSIGGHSIIGDRTNIGMNAVVHQRRVIGAGAMVGMGTPVSRDIPPFAKVFGTPPRLQGVNSVGLERMGFDSTVVAALRAAYEDGDLLLEEAAHQASLEPIAEFVSWWAAHEGRVPVRSSLGRSVTGEA